MYNVCIYIYVYPSFSVHLHPPTSARRAAAARSASPARSRRRSSCAKGIFSGKGGEINRCLLKKIYPIYPSTIVEIYIYIYIIIECKINDDTFCIWNDVCIYIYTYIKYIYMGYRCINEYQINMYVKSVYCIRKMYVWRDLYACNVSVYICNWVCNLEQF